MTTLQIPKYPNLPSQLLCQVENVTLHDYTIQPPTQELVVRDLHDNTWTFPYIYYVGVKRGASQQTSLPSSFLSADSVYIGVLVAATHAATNQTPFIIFYNPSKQVEWDEPGCSNKQNRVSSWGTENPKSLFIFPSLTLSLKRPLEHGLFELEVVSDCTLEFRSMEGCNVEKMAINPLSPHSLANQLIFLNQNQSPLVVNILQSDSVIVIDLIPQLDINGWMVYSSC
ncbi:Auxin response factor 5 [Spatholobus suberectus]|nr:Auxin response factor 5 [Spatholobus suberectus]